MGGLRSQSGPTSDRDASLKTVRRRSLELVWNGLKAPRGSGTLGKSNAIRRGRIYREANKIEARHSVEGYCYYSEHMGSLATDG
jgi:hypothetical protein